MYGRMPITAMRDEARDERALAVARAMKSASEVMRFCFEMQDLAHHIHQRDHQVGLM